MSGKHEDAVEASAGEYPAYSSFEDMGLQAGLLSGIFSYGFEKPSEIQQRAIRPIMDGRDTIGQAQSGSGKTAAFVAGALARMDFEQIMCQTLILAPTRELALQIQKVASALGSHLDARCYACIGGTAWREDAKALQAGQHLVVGTPGRVLDMIEKGVFGVAGIQVLVLDEADEMLSQGFEKQIFFIVKTLHPEVQVCLFSATLPPDILELSSRFMREPVRILVRQDELSADGLRQFHVAVEREEWKLEVLCDLYESMMVTQSIIYCNTQRKVDHLARDMARRDFPVSVVHAGLAQEERRAVLQEFQSGASRALISTDLLARGISVQQASLTINYDMPQIAASYRRRIGGGGCHGRKRIVISFVTHRDMGVLREIERQFATKIEELPADIAEVI